MCEFKDYPHLSLDTAIVSDKTGWMDVGGMTHATIQTKATDAAWGAAELEVQRSNDGVNPVAYGTPEVISTDTLTPIELDSKLIRLIVKTPGTVKVSAAIYAQSKPSA